MEDIKRPDLIIGVATQWRGDRLADVIDGFLLPGKEQNIEFLMGSISDEAIRANVRWHIEILRILLAAGV